jgi:prophage DNA circulation protein
MSWKERTRQTIDLTSPDGNFFSALWMGNKVPSSKKLGIFDFPLIDGNVVQDLGITGNRYPMTIHFEGINNDLIAQNFIKALEQRGVWEVTHPTLGLKKLQPISFSPNYDPVNSGNITTIETEWIEPISDQVVQSIPELANNIEAEKDDLNINSIEQFEVVSQDTTSERIEVVKVSDSGISAVINNLSSIYNQASDVAADTKAIITAMKNNLQQTVLDIVSLGGQINAVVQTPALAINDFTSRLSSYAGMISDMFGTLPDAITPESKSGTMATEQFLTAAIGAIGLISITSEFTTRSEITNAIDQINSVFLSIIDNLEIVQTNFSTLPIDLQYFSFLFTYGNLSLYFGQIIAFLLRSSLSLKVEKRFKLDRSRTPWEIALTEYNGPGENDNNLDLFILSNKLTGDEILLLPPGKEVVIYV